MRQTEAAADHAAVAKEVAHLVGAGARREVEVFGLSAQHQIAHSTAYEVGRVPVSIEAANHFCCVLVNEPTRNRVGVNERLGRLFKGASIFVFSLTEVSIYNSGHRIPKPMKAKK
jgi:hypothetical protein